MLAYHPRYSFVTAFTGIWRLTERVVATFGGDLFIRYPNPVPHGPGPARQASRTRSCMRTASSGADRLSP